jgi:hypothetical protein
MHGIGGRSGRFRRTNQFADLDAIAMEKRVYFRRSLGQLSSIVMKKVAKLLEGLQTTTIGEIEEAEEDIGSSSEKYRDQLENYSALADDSEAGVAWDRYYEIGRDV